jgi:DNA-directed RNA polymerase specialized sigma subunit
MVFCPFSQQRMLVRLTFAWSAQLLQISRSYVSRLETHALDQLRKGWLQESPGE